MAIDIERLGPAAQKQIRDELERRRRENMARKRQSEAKEHPRERNLVRIVEAGWKKNTTWSISGRKKLPDASPMWSGTSGMN